MIILFVASCKHTPMIDRIKYAEYMPKNSVENIFYSEEQFSDIENLVSLISKKLVQPNSGKFELGLYSAELILENKKSYWYLRPVNSGTGPFIILATRSKYNLVFEAPHPIIDRGTGTQAVFLLKTLEGRAAIISGNHRCAARSKTTCSGKTKVCGGRKKAYPTSDPAHSLDNLFHSTHTFFSKLWPNALFIQLHGFSGKGTDALFVISDGSTRKVYKDIGIAGKVRDRIRESLGQSKLATSCQDLRDNRYKYRRVCGRTNIQGRQLNGSADICHKSVKASSGRFLHIEQQWSVRKSVKEFGYGALDDKYQRALIKSLKAVSPCISTCAD